MSFPRLVVRSKLIREFEEMVDRLLPKLTSETKDEVRELVAYYMDIRGYGPVKEQAAGDIRAKIASHAIMHE